MDRFDFSQLLNWGWYGFLVSFSWGILLFFSLRNKRSIWKSWFLKWLIAGGIVAALTMGVVALFPPSIEVERLWAQATFGDTLTITDSNNTVLGQVIFADGQTFLQSPVNGKLPESYYTSVPLPKNQIYYNLNLLQNGRALKTYRIYGYDTAAPIVHGRVMLRNGYIQTVTPEVLDKVLNCIEAQ